MLEKYEHLDKLKHEEGGASGGGGGGSEHAKPGGKQVAAPMSAASAPPASTTAAEFDGFASGRCGLQAEAQAEAGEGGAESETLKIDSPGAGETQHPGEAAPAALVQEQVGSWAGLGWLLGSGAGGAER